MHDPFMLIFSFFFLEVVSKVPTNNSIKKERKELQRMPKILINVKFYTQPPKKMKKIWDLEKVKI